MEIQDQSIHELQYKFNEVYPSIKSISDCKTQLFEIYPQLKIKESSIYIINATLGTPPFGERKNSSIVQEIREAYKNGKKNFIFSCLHEGLPWHSIEKIHEVIQDITDIQSQISLLYATGAFNAEEMYKKLCLYKKVNPCIKILSVAAQENVNQKFLHFTQPYTTGKKDKKFLCFNKVNRMHRIILIEKLLKLNLVKDAFYSSYLDEDVFNLLKGDDKSDWTNILKNIDKFPMVLNRTKERDNPVDVIPDDLQYFNNSYFSVVTETIFYGNINRKPGIYYHTPEFYGIFPTEKIYKCLALNHPFVVLATNGFLKTLHNRGFKTFSPFINESYDDIVDDHDRLDAIVEEVNRLCNLSDEKLIEFTNNIKPIVEFNSQHYKDLTNFQITKNVLSLLK